METIVLLGAPGAGKGTVADDVKNATAFMHISTGDMLRTAMKEKRLLGLEAKKFIDAGELVSDDVMLGLVTELMDAGPVGAKYMFDGFPRTLVQAHLFAEALEERGAHLLSVFLLEISQDVVLERMAGRRICRDCGAVYHIRNIPPRVDGVCDSCGGDLYERPDDAEETVLNRLEVYKERTEGLIDYYESRGLLVRVDGNRRREETAADILAALDGAPGGS